MAQNYFRFTLNNPVAGAKTISEPDGWSKIKIILERDPEYHSLVEMIETPFIFYGSNGVHDGGMDYLDQFKLNDQVTIQIEISQDKISWEEMFDGLIDIQSKQRIDSRKVQYVITRNSLWTKFKSRTDTAVDIRSTVDQDGAAITPLPTVDLLMTSQVIKMIGHYVANKRNDMGTDWTGTPASASQNIDFKVGQNVVFGLDTDVIDEVKTKYNLGTGAIDADATMPEFFIPEYEGQITFEIGISVTKKVLQTATGDYYYAETSGADGGLHQLKLYIRKNSEVEIEIPRTDHGQIVAPVTSTHTFTPTSRGEDRWSFYSDTVVMNVLPNDSIYIYFRVFGDPFFERYNGFSAQIFQPVILGDDNSDIQWSDLATKLPFQAAGIPASDPVIQSYIKITALTEFSDTETEAFLLHDVAGGIIDRITGTREKFNSEYLGSLYTNYKTYPENGCGWPHILVRGLQIRQYTLDEKPMSISFKSWWDGINPIANLGVGYEVIDGEEQIEVEEKAAFYDEDPIIYFNWVNNIKESYDRKLIFNKIKVGYRIWKSEDILGIDDPQTIHEYAPLFETIGETLDIQSEFIAASLAWETTRRALRIKSADYKFDDNTFILALDRAFTAPYRPELDDYFSSITNLENPETRYNSALTPGRNVLRWQNYWEGCLQDYLTSIVKFNRGEGNYDMTSTWNGFIYGNCFNITELNFSEKQDIDLSIYGGISGHLMRPDMFEFDYPLSYEQYKVIKTNRKRALAVSESDSGHDICFIKRMEYDLVKSLAKFVVWKK